MSRLPYRVLGSHTCPSAHCQRTRRCGGPCRITSRPQRSSIASPCASPSARDLEQQPLGLGDRGEQRLELGDGQRARLVCRLAIGAGPLRDNDADPRRRVQADKALLHRVAEQRPQDGHVLADRRLGQQPVRARIALLDEPAHERLDVARLDLGQSQPHRPSK
jgi:hypothetical protein